MKVFLFLVTGSIVAILAPGVPLVGLGAGLVDYWNIFLLCPCVLKTCSEKGILIKY